MGYMLTEATGSYTKTNTTQSIQKTHTHSRWKVRDHIQIYTSIPSELAASLACLWFATPISYEKMRQSCNYGRSRYCHNPSPLTGQNKAGCRGNQRRWGWCRRAHGCAWGRSLARLYHKVTSNRWGSNKPNWMLGYEGRSINHIG